MARKSTEDGKRQGSRKEKKKRGKAEDVRPDLIKLIHLKFKCAELHNNSVLTKFPLRQQPKE